MYIYIYTYIHIYIRTHIYIAATVIKDIKISMVCYKESV